MKYLYVIIFFFPFLCNAQDKDSVTLILKNNQKIDYLLNPFVNTIGYDNVKTTINKDTLIFKASFLLEDTILFNNGTLGYNFRRNVQPKERVEKTIYINPLPFISKMIKVEIRDKDKEYIYYFRHKRKKVYTFCKLEISSSISD